jgi:hypothetical protein
MGAKLHTDELLGLALAGVHGPVRQLDSKHFSKGSLPNEIPGFVSEPLDWSS